MLREVKKFAILTLVLLVCLLGIMLNTRPDTVPLAVLMLPFMIIFLVGFLVSYMTLRYGLKKPHTIGIMSLAVLAGSLAALALGLNSVGSLLPREIAIVLVFFSVLFLYAFKRRF
jgi:hypothetical protein